MLAATWAHIDLNLITSRADNSRQNKSLKIKLFDSRLIDWIDWERKKIIVCIYLIGEVETSTLIKAYIQQTWHAVGGAPVVEQSW